MSVKVMQTEAVQTLLEKASGFDQSGGNQRAKTLIHRVLSDLYKAVDDLNVTDQEFWAAMSYLNELGQSGEAALLAAGIGFEHFLDIRSDAIDAAEGLEGGTPRTIEGPLYVAGAPISDGFARMDDGKDPAETMIVTGTVTDNNGQPIAGAVVDIWHANSKGCYSYFDKSQSDYNLRRRIRTDENGRYVARSIVPSGYGCPPEGPTQKLLDLIGRHGNRPAHIHYFISADNYRHLTTQINLDGDPYLHDDFAFATRDELIAEAKKITDPAKAEAYGLSGPFNLVTFDITLLPTENDDKTHRGNRERALEA